MSGFTMKSLDAIDNAMTGDCDGVMARDWWTG
jgi:hypothetical protein